MKILLDFFNSFFLWREALLASAAVSLLCGWLGVYVVLKRIVFVSAALPQASGLGIAAAFYAASFFGIQSGETSLFFPFAASIIFSCALAILFSLNSDRRRLSTETQLGLSYILCVAIVLLILNSPRIVQESHEIGDILFGNAVVVEGALLYGILFISALVLSFHALFFKEFIATMFDYEASSILGLKVRAFNVLFYLTLAISISAATRTIGALPVFGFMVVPPATALLIARSLKGAIALSMFIGLFSSVVGYFLSYTFSTPTGATMVIVAGVWLLFAQVWRWRRA